MSKLILNNPSDYIRIHDMATKVMADGNDKQKRIVTSIMSQLASRGCISAKQLSCVSDIWVQVTDKEKVRKDRVKKVKASSESILDKIRREA